MSADRVILAIETSQRSGSVAARLPNGSVDAEALQTKTRHDDDLLPAIDRLLRRSGVPKRDLGAVAVSIGPGGFTGLRIAVATAKMFAEVLGAQLVAAPSALVAAEACDDPGPIAAALACKRERFWLSRMARDDDGRWRIEGEPAMTDATSATLDDVRVVLADAHLPEAMRGRCHAEGIAVIEPTFDARACLAVAARMLERGETTDAAALVPLYAREPEAARLWESRKAGKQESQTAKQPNSRN